MNNVIKNTTPVQLGFRMPAEWERQEAIWLQWPGRHPAATADDDLFYQLQMEKTWMLMSWEIHQQVSLCILTSNESQKDHIHRSMTYFGFDMSKIEFHFTKLVDVWHRDTGPTFLVDDKGKLAVTDWNFNGWGTYPEWGNAECHIAQTVANITNAPVYIAPLITEGGAIEVNGSGTLMATRSSIINDNRNPNMSQEQIEQVLKDYLGVSHFIWLSGAPAEVCEQVLGDSTDYHIDIAARFVAANKILYAWTDEQDDPRYPYLVKHLEELTAATDERGKPLTLIPVPLPAGGVYAIGGRHDPALDSGSHFTDASYLNYLVSNNIVLVPAFGNANDVQAQRILAECFPDRKIIPIPVVSLTAEGGAIHCVTQQQPAVVNASMSQ